MTETSTSLEAHLECKTNCPKLIRRLVCESLAKAFVDILQRPKMSLASGLLRTRRHFSAPIHSIFQYLFP